MHQIFFRRKTLKNLRGISSFEWRQHSFCAKHFLKNIKNKGLQKIVKTHDMVQKYDVICSTKISIKGVYK